MMSTGPVRTYVQPHLKVFTSIKVHLKGHVLVYVTRGGSRIFREGGLNIEVISEAWSLGGTAPRSYRVF